MELLTFLFPMSGLEISGSILYGGSWLIVYPKDPEAWEGGLHTDQFSIPCFEIVC